MRVLWMVFAILGCGCAVEAEDDTGSGSAATCTPLTGAYVVSWRERAGGTCGPITDMVVQMAEAERAVTTRIDATNIVFVAR